MEHKMVVFRHLFNRLLSIRLNKKEQDELDTIFQIPQNNDYDKIMIQNYPEKKLKRKRE